ncbi:MAG: hypothetical protein H0X25_13830 [Acidobacteriales bacterium]|nr:hypothetical protein [Terriglobales bacterium]
MKKLYMIPALLVLLPACGGSPSKPSSATPTQAPLSSSTAPVTAASTPTVAPTTTAPVAVAPKPASDAIKTAPLVACFKRHHATDVSLGNDGVVTADFGQNYIRVWLYATPRLAGYSLKQATALNLVDPSLYSTVKNVFYQWQATPAPEQVKAQTDCLKP